MTETPNSTQTVAARSPLWMRVTLIVSLALNLLIAGVVAGAYMSRSDIRQSHKYGGSPEERLMREMGFGPFLNAFEPEQSRALGRMIRREVGSLAMNREALRQELSTMVTTLRSTPYDHAAFSAVLERQRQRMTARTEAAMNVVLKAIGDASDAERAAFADRLERSLQRAMERAQARRGAAGNKMNPESGQ